MDDIVPALVGLARFALFVRWVGCICVRPPTGPCAAVLGWKFRAATKNSCDAVVAEFFEALCEAATATRSTPKPGHMALSVGSVGWESFNLTDDSRTRLANMYREPSCWGW